MQCKHGRHPFAPVGHFCFLGYSKAASNRFTLPTSVCLKRGLSLIQYFGDQREVISFPAWQACFVTIDRGAKNRISGASATPERKEHEIPGPTTSLGALASLQSTGAQRTGSQEQVQHQNAKSTQYRDQQLAYCALRSACFATENSK